MKLALVSIITSQLADGVAANTVQISVTDDSGAALPGASLYLSADNGATVTPVRGLTDANGQLTASILSSTTGACTVTAELADTTLGSIQVYFVAVPAAVVSVTVTPAVADEVKASVADFEAADEVKASVADFEAADEVKAGVADFEAALSFVESGVAQLGEVAKDELKELAKKYL